MLGVKSAVVEETDLTFPVSEATFGESESSDRRLP